MSQKSCLRFGSDKTFWLNVEKLRRILITFTKNDASKNIDNSSKLIEKECVPGESKISNEFKKQELLHKIEKILQEYVSKSNSNETAVSQIPNRKVWKNTCFKRETGVQLIENPILTTVGTQRSSKKIVRLLQVLTKIHKLIKTNTYRTKRELYYEDVTLFKTQSVLDEILDDIACLLKSPKIELHVLTTSKGCIAGNLRYKEAEGNYVDCNETTQGILLPNEVGSINYIQSDARFILLVEKSAVFQMLLDCRITESLYPCIIITGKGFPDVNTREMLRKLWDTLQIPILGLVDADPYGIEILSIYKYGSMAMSFDVENLTVPEIKWIGLLPTDIQKLKFPHTATIPMTDRDIKKAKGLLDRPYIKQNKQWEDQILLMLKTLKKAEIEGLSKMGDNFLASVYLPSKIRYGGWI